jgi:hypothetical protein
MSTTQLWRAIGEQAAAWRATPTISRFVRELPRNARQRTKGLPGLLQGMQAGAGFVDALPLRLATNLRLAAAVMDVDPKQLEADHGDWLAAVGQAEGAHRATVAWLRARLPGYPALPAPQLAPGSPLTTPEFSNRLVWTPGERGQGLQLAEPQPTIAEALGADDAQRRALDQAARQVAAALLATPEWQALDAATAALGEADRAVLAASRKHLHERLAPAKIDDYEPSLALERARYRTMVVDQELLGLTGPAHDYAAAFGAADLLIEVAASDVFAQLLCYRTPTLRPRDLEAEQGSAHRLAFSVDEGSSTFPEAGILVWLDDAVIDGAVIDDAVVLTGSAMRWDGSRSSHAVRATVLRGSGSAWRS